MFSSLGKAVWMQQEMQSLVWVTGVVKARYQEQ
jgi:hypothetical protein